MEKIRWAARLEPSLLKRLYEADAKGIRDAELCDEIGSILYARCETFHAVARQELPCPRCSRVFAVQDEGWSICPTERCGWVTSKDEYARSVKNHYAWKGRAGDAFEEFRRRFPSAPDYSSKMVLIDQLIHSFHIAESGSPVKSVASKLLEGNKKRVVRFLNELSSRNPTEKDSWRSKMSRTIDAREVTHGKA